jgi:hypothetical protein
MNNISELLLGNFLMVLENFYMRGPHRSSFLFAYIVHDDNDYSNFDPMILMLTILQELEIMKYY